MARPLGSGPIHVYIGFGPPPTVATPAIPATTETQQTAYYGTNGSVYYSTTVIEVPEVPAVTGVGMQQAIYYGTTQKGPEIRERLYYRPFMSDLTGPDQSFDSDFIGREDDIVVAMTNWNQSLENDLESLPITDLGFNPAKRGTLLLSSIGSLAVIEGLTVGIWLVKAGASKPLNVAASMPRGRYYPTCVMTGPVDKVEGNKENIMVRKFTAKLNVARRATGSLPLFLEDDASFSGLPTPTFS